MMSAPSAAIRTACARPCPRAAPVMNATLPASRPVIRIPSVGGSRVPLCGFDQTRADDQPLDLTGALIQSQQPDIAVDAFDRHPAHVAGAAVDLYREIGDLAGHLGAVQLGRR